MMKDFPDRIKELTGKTGRKKKHQAVFSGLIYVIIEISFAALFDLCSRRPRTGYIPTIRNFHASTKSESHILHFKYIFLFSTLKLLWSFLNTFRDSRAMKTIVTS